MSRNPFKPTADQSTEFGFGAGQFPRQDIDFSQGGFKSRFPIADPDRTQQLLDLRAAHRTDLTNPAEPDLPAFQGSHGSAPMHYKEGNTDRYGAQPPLVRATAYPTFKRERPVPKPRMRRAP